MKKILMLVILSIGIASAYAKYDRHDGSQYSCNEINAERAYANKTDKQEFSKLDKEYKKYCK